MQTGTVFVCASVFVCAVMFFCVGKTACRCLCSVAENALVDFSLGKQRDRKSTTQKVEGREERGEGKRTSPGKFPTLSEKKWQTGGTKERQSETEAKRDLN